MRPAEQGFLLLTERLGDLECKPLTIAQFRNLTIRVMMAHRNADCRDLSPSDVVALGYDVVEAKRIVNLLSRQEQLQAYISHAAKMDCYPITRIHEYYPGILRKRLGLDSPGCLWAKGDVSLLNYPAVSLVGSRVLRNENAAFAAEVGRQAALQGIVLVSGNARGADKTAQECCLENGGKVISVVADQLEKCPLTKSVLYLCEDGVEYPFSALRAISRNRIIHSLGRITFVAQCTLNKGGTWNGTTANLRHGWSPVFCYEDHSSSVEALCQRGANTIGPDALQDLDTLADPNLSLF